MQVRFGQEALPVRRFVSWSEELGHVVSRESVLENDSVSHRLRLRIGSNRQFAGFGALGCPLNWPSAKLLRSIGVSWGRWVIQVDAFTLGPFSRNPAAVCPLDTRLDNATMQNIAADEEYLITRLNRLDNGVGSDRNVKQS